VQLLNKPVNALTLELLEELRTTIVELEEDPQVRGVVLGSAVPNIFSGGLNLMTFYGADSDTLTTYWTAVQEMWMTLYITPLATVAAINGHSPAGGCLLAMSCDARVMVEGSKFGIGLNETKLGIVAPMWFADAFRAILGRKKADSMLILGELASPAQALEIGLVDAVVPLHQLQGAADEFLAAQLAIPDAARAATKRQLRLAQVEALRSTQAEDLDEFIRLILSPAVQSALGDYLASLKKKKAPKE